MSPWSPLCDNFSVFLDFPDPDTFEEDWSGILQNVPQFGCVWYFLRRLLGLWVWGKSPTEVRECPSHHDISGASDTADWRCLCHCRWCWPCPLAQGGVSHVSTVELLSFLPLLCALEASHHPAYCQGEGSPATPPGGGISKNSWTQVKLPQWLVNIWGKCFKAMQISCLSSKFCQLI